MKNLLSLVLLSSCASRGRIVTLRENFIAIEVPPQNLLFVCGHDPDPQTDISTFGAYATLDKVLYLFSFRSVLDHQTCEDVKKKYQALAQGSRQVRLVGSMPDIKAFEARNTPKPVLQLGPFRKEVSATFTRIQSGAQCESFFEGDCAPDKYWGGMVPGKFLNKP